MPLAGHSRLWSRPQPDRLGLGSLREDRQPWAQREPELPSTEVSATGTKTLSNACQLTYNRSYNRLHIGVSRVRDRSHVPVPQLFAGPGGPGKCRRRRGLGRSKVGRSTAHVHATSTETSKVGTNIQTREGEQGPQLRVYAEA
eukprot:3616534-Rhodomonas_salina.2